MKKYLLLAIVLLTVLLFAGCTNEQTKTDAQKFAADYNVSAENIVEYRTAEEILRILDGGTGVIFFGDKSSKTCQSFAPRLLEAVRLSSEDAPAKILYVDTAVLSNENLEKIKDKLELKDNTFAVPLVYGVAVGKGVDLYTALSGIEEIDDTYWITEKTETFNKSIAILCRSVKLGCNAGC